MKLLVVVAALLLLAGCAGLPREERTGGVRVIRVAPDAPLGATAPAAATPAPSEAASPSSLQRVLDTLAGPARLLLAPGQYHLAARDWRDPSCGNCEDPATPIPATVGLRVSGRGIEIAGVHADSVVIHTNAGYGILFDRCDGCALRAVTVTGGRRDADGRATDGAVVVRESTVVLEACALRDNLGDSATITQVVVGIIGVVGREGARIDVRGCRIERNSWDGIALYHGARASIQGNVIDGVDKAAGARVGGGRGVGIGLTWDAEAEVVGNLVRRYWKGIGVFVDARAEVRHNVVEDVLTWGIAYWGAGRGRAVARIRENAVFGTGACGAMLDRASDPVGDPSAPLGAGAGAPDAPGDFIGNAIVRTGQNARYDSGEPYCVQRPLARHAVPAGFAIERNLFHDNRQPGDAAREPELERAAFEAALAPLLNALRAYPALAGSAFLREFGGGR